MTDRIYPFGYYGGKLSHLGNLLPLLPTAGVQTYVEPFSGSAAVLLNRDPSPVEVYNDLDSEVVTFFRVLRERPDDLIRAIQLTPYSREEFARACERRKNLPLLERARRFYIGVSQSRYNLPAPMPSNWSYCVSDSNRGMASAISAWGSVIDGLNEVARRLLRVQIEHLPAVDVMARYDSEQTLFYIDPPYVSEARASRNTYAHEMTDEQHRELAVTAHACRGKVAVSGYESALYHDLFADWRVTLLPARTAAATNTYGVRTLRQEILWTNYDPADVHQVSDLPLFRALEGGAA